VIYDYPTFVQPHINNGYNYNNNHGYNEIPNVSHHQQMHSYEMIQVTQENFQPNAYESYPQNPPQYNGYAPENGIVQQEEEIYEYPCYTYMYEDGTIDNRTFVDPASHGYQSNNYQENYGGDQNYQYHPSATIFQGERAISPPGPVLTTDNPSHVIEGSQYLNG
jgi:hypothetical protein